MTKLLSEPIVAGVIGLERSETQQVGMPDPPFIARMAGLPAESLAQFASSACLGYLESQRQILDGLAEARSRLVDLLAELLPRQSPKLRRFFLSIKRDSFNGRSLVGASSQPEWEEVDNLTEGLAGAVLKLECRMAEAEQEFAELYALELERERGHLFGLLRNERFLRGLALGSPELVSQARVLLDNDGSLGRHSKKVEQSLLRFVTRTAAKLSPYSTLTTLGLGLINEKLPLGFRFVPGLLRETSLVRANSVLLHQRRELLMRHPRVRGICPVALNDTAHELGSGQWQFLRNGHWTFLEEAGEVRFVPARFIRAEISGPVVASIRGLLATGPLPFQVLLERLRERHPERRDDGAGCPIHALLDRLAALGFLCLLPPWSTSEVYVEKQMLETLSSLPCDIAEPVLKELETSLCQLLMLEREHAKAERPELSSKALAAALGQVLDCIDSAAGIDLVTKGKQSFYEDVFMMTSGENCSIGEVVQLSAQTAREILAHADLVSRYACLFNHRHDVLHALAAFWAERWPSRRELGVLELFQAFQEIWSRYLRFDLTERYDNFSSFDPLGLTSMEALSQIRKTVREGTICLLQEGLGGMHLPVRSFEALLEKIPRRYRPILGCSVFLQPAGLQSRMWVLNRLFEGSGRYLSRYPAAMEEPMRSQFTSHLTARSSLEVDGEPADLLDLMFTHGNMSSLRFPQTLRVLELPGERLDLRAGQRVLLSELRIEADLSTEDLRLVDLTGRRLIPVHLSSVNNVFIPVLLRFLSLFGPYEMRQVFPRGPMEAGKNVSVSRRLTCGNLVVRRTRWEIPKGSLERIGALSGAAAFRAIDMWRDMLRLPQRVFVYEQMHQDGAPVQSFKPQYIDFSSPCLSSLFLSIIRNGAPSLLLEECLPTYSEFPANSEGKTFALEFQIDSLALGGLHGGALGKEKNEREPEESLG